MQIELVVRVLWLLLEWQRQEEGLFNFSKSLLLSKKIYTWDNIVELQMFTVYVNSDWIEMAA